MGELAAGHASPRSGIAKAANPDPYSPERVEGDSPKFALTGFSEGRVAPVRRLHSCWTQAFLL
jgi:hypothetical protein